MTTTGCFALVCTIEMGASSPTHTYPLASVLDTISVVLGIHGLYHYLIVNFGDLEVLQVQVWFVDSILRNFCTWPNLLLASGPCR
jgi:hypothetical protein